MSAGQVTQPNPVYDTTEDPFSPGAFSDISGRDPEYYQVRDDYIEHPGFCGFQLQDRPSITTLRIYNGSDSDDSNDSNMFGTELVVIQTGTPNASQVKVNPTNGWCQVHTSHLLQFFIATYDSRGTNNAFDSVEQKVADSIGTQIEEEVAEQVPILVQPIIDSSISTAIAGPIQDNIDAAIDALPPISEIAWLYDVKSTGTDGGSFSNGAWQTRDLNTLVSGPNVTWISRSGNQFSLLEVGTYEIYASAPARAVESHKAKLRNITDSTDDLVGTSEIATSASAGANRSITQGQIVIASAPKTFEIQHRCQTTAATLGFGASAGFSVEEKYTIVKLQKIA